MTETTFDVIVVGGGPGGYVAAIRAAQLGLEAAVVEREHLGGICLNWGCIPTKTLLHTADLYREIQDAESYGITAKANFDIDKVVSRSRAVANQLNSGVKFLLKKHNVEVYDGFARLTGEGCLEVEKDGEVVAQLGADNIIVATGARARSLPGLEPDGELIWTYKEAMVPTTMPASLLVIGSGAIGVEFASFYRSLGSEVTVVEVLPRILPVEDEEISAFAREEFEKQGITIHTNATVQALEKGSDSVTATITTDDGPIEATFDRAILAVGVTGNVEGLGLEATAATVDRGAIVVNEWLETEETGLYAIGDVAGPPLLAHKAMHEGVLCVDRIAGLASARPIERRRIPGCTYCHPQIASVGLTEAAAQEEGFKVRVGRFPLVGNGKAIAVGDTAGMVKTVFDSDTDELLGAHMVGPDVTEMIQGFVVAMGLETTEAELMETIFPHPTISEAMHESVLEAYDRALHI
ncbi:MAG: dihydrolipoyl dehydrogenase [Dehalococcoidia bacterium]|nr:dihydrolipoyl dehydrogenase [Dehalococcoidia bacterium]HCV00450.1 dihydrolipoyl dehydrogenase [Dehalococcoidia bacterium]|tara:strand:- start:1100 stop:2497 length:1398 start_codon:yes stop_codon:yes gene_type:complete